MSIHISRLFPCYIGLRRVYPQNASAQAGDKQIIDEIVCRGLSIVNAENKIIVRLVADAEDEGGMISISNKVGFPVATLSVIEEGGSLSIANRVGQAVAALIAEDEGGSLNIFGSNRNKSGARLSANKNGGVLTVRYKGRSKSFY